MTYLDFISLDSPPSSREVVATYRAEPSEGSTFEHVAGGVAAESSIGTWDPGLSTMREGIRELGARVFELDPSRKIFKVAYPPELFEAGSLPQILSSIVGNVYGLKEVRRLRLLDVEFPEDLLRSFLGPQVGIEGIRKIVGFQDRPIVGTIVKPKLGLSSEEWAEAAFRAWRGGLDAVKDDENLTSMTFNSFERRMERVFEARRRAERETGEKKIYFPNISAPYVEMRRRAQIVEEHGGEFVMIDILTVGWSALQEMRRELEGRTIGIHAHRAMHGAFTRLEDHGIDFLPVARWARLAGVDTLHSGSAGAGKMATEGGVDHVKKIYDFLRSPWGGIRRVLPVASGGLHPGVLPLLVGAVGVECMAMFGGGVHGHPQGSEAGARAVRAAVEAVVEGTPLEEAARKSPELSQALSKWGRRVTGGSE